MYRLVTKLALSVLFFFSSSIVAIVSSQHHHLSNSLVHSSSSSPSLGGPLGGSAPSGPIWSHLAVIFLMMVWASVWVQAGVSSGNLFSHRAFVVSPTVLQCLMALHMRASMTVLSLPATTHVMHWSTYFISWSHWSASLFASISGNIT